MVPFAFSVRDGAAAAGISEIELRRRLRAGQLAHVRIGRRILIRQADLQAFLDQHAVPARVVG